MITLQQTDVIWFCISIALVFFGAGMAAGIGFADAKRREREIKELEDSYNREVERQERKGGVL